MHNNFNYSCNVPMTVFSPEKAVLVAVNSAFPRLVRGRSGRLGEPVMINSLWWIVAKRRMTNDEIKEPRQKIANNAQRSIL